MEKKILRAWDEKDADKQTITIGEPTESPLPRKEIEREETEQQYVAELPKSLPIDPIEEKTNEEVAGIPIGELIKKLSDPAFDRKSF